MTLQETLRQVENALGVYGRSIYTKLNIKQTTYSSWRSGRKQNPKIDLHGKLQTEFGIDLNASQRKGEVVISNNELFQMHRKKINPVIRPIVPVATACFMLLVLTYCTSAKAQRINAGLRFAGNVTLHGGELILQNPPQDYRPYELRGRLGLNLNTFAEINIVRHFAIEPEIGYKHVQWELTDEKSPTPRPYIYTNTYWEIPLLLKYKVAGFGAYLGAEMDIFTTSRAEEPAGEGLGTGIGYPNTDADFKTKTPWYGVIGIEYTMRRPGFGASLRYLHGFNDVFAADNSLIVASQFKAVKGRQLQFGVHWRFGRDKSRWKNV